MLFAWQGLELEHPDDWECMRYSKSRRRGECTLADRHGVRLILNWHAAKGSADFSKMFKALATELGKSDREGKAGAIQSGPGQWRCMEWMGGPKHSGASAIIALAQFAERGCVVKAELPVTKATRKESLRVLESFSCRKTSGQWHWSAFGCRLYLPAEMELESCEVLPGRASMAFRQKGRAGQSFRLHRLAMPETHLKGRGLKEWMSGTTRSEQERVQDIRPRPFRGHEAFSARLRPVADTALQRLLRRKWRGQAAVWICDREQRLYRAEWDGAPSVNEPALESWVECQ
ncbi:MAG TPA: hypothetical protein VEJ63_23565 [Planctomycetota bacterium]|nr:hypothetical protein [Planctomycetota bacterium]